ncbi:MAG: hypothetical protein WCX97_05190 [Candidatus Magasanikbacteria bacterium]
MIRVTQSKGGVKGVKEYEIVGRLCPGCIHLREREVRIKRIYKDGREVEGVGKRVWCDVYVKMYWELMEMEDGGVGGKLTETDRVSKKLISLLSRGDEGKCRGYSDDFIVEFNRLLEQVQYVKSHGGRIDRALREEVRRAIEKVKVLARDVPGWEKVYYGEIHKKLVKFCGEKSERTHTGAPAKGRNRMNDALWGEVGKKWYRD